MARHRPELRAILTAGAVDILFANEAEALALSGAPDAERALSTLASSVPICTVTRGALGSLIQAAGQIHATPALPAHVVDATGAGDLYAAGVLTGLLAGLDPPRAAGLGAASAAEAVSHFTSRPATSLASLLSKFLPS